MTSEFEVQAAEWVKMLLPGMEKFGETISVTTNIPLLLPALVREHKNK